VRENGRTSERENEERERERQERESKKGKMRECTHKKE
jgi:hypothetical protein